MTGDSGLEKRRQEAAAWFSRLNQRRVSTDDVQGFFEWRKDPANARAYEAIENVWTAAEALAGDPDITRATAEVTSRRRAPERARAHLAMAFRPLAVSLTVLVLAGAGVLWMNNRPAVYATEIGERRTIALADGSTVTLDTGSRVTVRLTRDRRAITLLDGQALFDVEHDAARPFVVAAGDTRVTALGTRFDVRRSGEGARVTLVTGRVAVETNGGVIRRWTLEPDQQLLTTRPDAAPAPADASREVSWA